MHDWQSKKKDSFIGTYDGYSFEELGVSYHSNFYWGSRLVSIKKVDQSVEYKLLAAAAMNEQTEPHTLYLFVLHNDHPVVLCSRVQTMGITYLYDSQNFELQAGFNKIVTGNTIPKLNDFDLNRDVEQRSSAIIPQNYHRLWYYYNDQVEQFDLTHQPEDMEISNEGKWLLIKDVEEEGGKNFKMYLRHRFFDGQQVPVGILKDDSIFNCYEDVQQAEILQDYLYGDES